MRTALLILLLSTGVASADVTRVDVDGDGKADQVTVDATGVSAAVGKKTHDHRFAVSGTFVGARVTSGGKGKQPYLAIEATFEVDGRKVGEGLVLQWRKGALVEVWRGDVGPIGLDGDYAVKIDATPAGVVRSQARAGFQRCDGGAVELFREGWNDSAGKFQPIRGSVTIAANATTLKATREAPEGEPTLSATYRAAITSTEAGATDASQLGAPYQLDDGDPKTAWREDRGGDGRGEWFTYRARQKGVKVAALRILAGDARGATEMAASNRVAKLAVVTATAAYWIEIPDEAKPDAWWVKLPAPVEADCVTVLLGGFHPGKGQKDGKGTSVISELVVLGEEDIAPGGAAAKLIADVIAGGIDGDSASKLLARRGASAARAIEAALAAGDLGGDAEVRLWKVLALIGDPGSAAALGEGLRAAGLTDDDAWLIAEALGNLGEPGQAELARAVADIGLKDAVRTGAAKYLDDAHDDVLIAALGSGSRKVRKVIAMLVASIGVQGLIAAAAQAEADGALEREADLWRMMALAAMREDDASRSIAIVALTARGREATTYELRYRIVGALSTLPVVEAVAAVRELLEPLTGNEGAAIRQVAAGGLGGLALPEAATLLADLSTNDDPGVRIAALQALAGRGDLGADAWSGGGSPDAVDRVIINALAGDTWPEVRHTAAAALAIACPRKGPTEALEAAAESDEDMGVRADALSSLVTCKAPGIAARLLGIAKDGDAALGLRDRAVDLLGVLGDLAVAPDLVKLLGKWRSAAFSEDAGLVLAQRAAVVIGRLGALTDDAKLLDSIVDALLDTADDGAFPEIQAAGAAGLGELGRHCNKEARALLKDLKTSDQAGVKMAAELALATCGK